MGKSKWALAHGLPLQAFKLHPLCNTLYLIPYAPELNLIEILWRHIKYFWLPFAAYQCMEALREALEQIVKDFGSKYQITFA
jgi:transposase